MKRRKGYIKVRKQECTWNNLWTVGTAAVWSNRFTSVGRREGEEAVAGYGLGWKVMKALPEYRSLDDPKAVAYNEMFLSRRRHDKGKIILVVIGKMQCISWKFFCSILFMNKTA